MDVLEKINQSIDWNHWNLDEKKRSIYLESCRLFSYDGRYHFLPTITEDQKRIQLEHLMRYKNIDLRNIEDFSLVCSTHSKVLNVLYQELLGISSFIHGNENEHNWIEVDNMPYSLRLDASYGRDFQNVKMNLPTHGYDLYLTPPEMDRHLKNQMQEQYQTYLKEIDSKISYHYSGNDLLNQFLKTFQMYYYFHFSSDAFLDYMFQFFQNWFQNFQFSNITDARYCIRHLQCFLNIEDFSIRNIDLYEAKDLEDWNFITIYLIQYKDEIVYGILKKRNGIYVLESICKDDACVYVKDFNGYNRELLLHSKTF